MKAVSKALETFLRFPLTISSFIGFFLIAMHASGCCEFWMNLDDTSLEEIMPFLAIGFFLMFAVELYSERKKINSAYLAFFIVSSLWIYFIYPLKNINEIINNRIDPNSLLFIASFILSLITLFTTKKPGENFWRYNKKLVARLAFTVFIAVVLYKVLVFFLLIIGELVYLHFEFLYLYLPDFEENSSWIAIFIATLAGMFFFLSGVPKAGIQKG